MCWREKRFKRGVVFRETKSVSYFEACEMGTEIKIIILLMLYNAELLTLKISLGFNVSRMRRLQPELFVPLLFPYQY